MTRDQHIGPRKRRKPPAEGTPLKRNSAAYQKLKRDYRHECQQRQSPCWLCRAHIDYAAPFGTPDSFEPDHYWPVSVRPDLALSRENLRPSHMKCNRARKDALPTQTEWVRPAW